MQKEVTVQKIDKLLDFSLLFSQTLEPTPPNPEPAFFQDTSVNSPLSEFFLYQGSFTTPSCEETVTYVVDRKIHPVSQSQLSIIQGFTTNFRQSNGNYRVTQLVNGRYIWVHSNQPEVVNSITTHLTDKTAQCDPIEYLLNYTTSAARQQYIISNQPKLSLERKEGLLTTVPVQ